jgi:hypothetical protein
MRQITLSSTQFANLDAMQANTRFRQEVIGLLIVLLALLVLIALSLIANFALEGVPAPSH